MNETEPTAGTPEKASSLHEVDVRAGRKGDVQESSRWVVEWWSDTLRQWYSTESKLTSSDALREYEALCVGLPRASVRVVVVVERRTIAEVRQASSHIH